MKNIFMSLILTILIMGSNAMASGLKEYKVEFVLSGNGNVYAENIYAYSSTEAWNRLVEKQKSNGKIAIQRSVKEVTRK